MGKLRDQLMAAQASREIFETQQQVRAKSEERVDHERSLAFLLCGLAAFYLTVRFGATQRLDTLGADAATFFEVSLVAFALLLLRPSFSTRAAFKPLTFVMSAAAFGLGFTILKLARLHGLQIPIDVHDRATVFALLVTAPVLEELVFRMVLFQPIARVWNPKIAVITTSLIFSYSHLHAIWFVPAEFDKFLIYQTLYTLPLGFACGWLLKRQNSLLSSISVHAMFNLGFFMAFGM